MKINFYPEYDNPELEKAAKDYDEIWQKGGNKITTIIERISGLKFKEKTINAVINEHTSYSLPLQFQANMSIEMRKRTLVHELCHRITYGNNINLNVTYKDQNWNLEVHKLINLILYDIYIALYGEKFAKKSIEYEISLWDGEGVSPYKIAWDWALAMTRGER